MKKIAILFVLVVCISIYPVIHYETTLPKDKEGCYILSKPTKITKAGCYKLRNDIIVPQNKKFAFYITNDDIKLDLNSKKILRKYQGKSKPKENFGLLIRRAKNIEITNGSFEDFYYSICITGSSDIQINHMHLNKVNNIGILISRDNNVKINHNIINLNALFKKTDPKNFYLVGINVVSSKNIDIKSNIINSLYPYTTEQNPLLEQVGIDLSSENKNVAIFNNKIVFIDLFKNTYGIWLSDKNSNIKLIEGTIFNAWKGITNAYPIKDSYIKKYKIINLFPSKGKKVNKCSTSPAGIEAVKSSPIKILSNQIVNYECLTREINK